LDFLDFFDFLDEDGGDLDLLSSPELDRLSLLFDEEILDEGLEDGRILGEFDSGSVLRGGVGDLDVSELEPLPPSLSPLVPSSSFFHR